jgi:magnesium-protoporphyrin O-methyltransferase
VSCPQCIGIEQEFGEGTARRQLRRYRRKGPEGTTRLLLDQIIGRGVKGRSFLDVGGGVGVIQHELMAAGAAGGECAEASPAYLAEARAEATRRGYTDRVVHHSGDFLDVATGIDDADIVTLDRVICCYPDMPRLVDESASRTRYLWGAVLPRDERLLVRMGIALINAVQWLRRRPFRVFAHPRHEVDLRLRNLGLLPCFQGTSFFWRVLLYERPPSDTSP